MDGTKMINTVCPMNCYSACGMRAHVQDGKLVKIEGNCQNLATYGKICAKGLRFPQLLASPERLLHPLKKKRGGGFERIPWQEAIDIIHERFTSISKQYGPESILYYAASGNHGSAMHAYPWGFWYQMGGCSATRGSLCAPAANEGVRYTYGICKDSAIADIQNAKLIILWGKNPAFTNVHTMRYIHAAIERGAKLVTIDPRMNESSAKSTLHLFPRCGTDGLLAIALAKFIIESGLSDDAFLARHAHGFEEYKAFLDGYSVDEICELAEIPFGQLSKLYELIRETPRFTLILGKGFQRCSNGGQASRAICLLPALTGAVGKSGSGLFYSDMQHPAFVWPFYPPRPNKIRQDISIGRVADAILTRNDPPIKAAWIGKANPVVSNPNQHKTMDAIRKLDFVVCAEHFLTDTAKMADIVLPAAMFLEDDDMVYSYGHSYIQLKQKAVECAGACKTDREMFRLLGQRFGFDMRYLPEDDEEILRGITKASGLKTSLERLREEPYLFDGFEEIAFSDLVFPTRSGKIEFYSEAIAEDWGVDPLPVFTEPPESKYSEPELFAKYPLQLMSAHPKDRINSQFEKAKPAQEVNETRVYLHSLDAQVRDIQEGDMVRVFNGRGELFRKAQVGEKIKPGVINVFEGEWRAAGASVNVLNEDRDTDIGFGTAYHNCLVEIEKTYEKS